jgi:hypothetical protein
MRERIKIMPAKFLRDSRMERAVMESHRADMFTYMLIVGAALLIFAMMM